MSDRQEFDDLLNDNLQHLVVRGSLKEIFLDKPNREELFSLLETADVTLAAAASVTARPDVQAKSFKRVVALSRCGVIRRRFNWRTWIPNFSKPLIAGFVMAFLMSFLAVGTSFASSDSVPGDPLYWVKINKENIILMIPKSNLIKAEQHIRLASERHREIEILIGRGQYSKAEKHGGAVRKHLGESASFTGVSSATDPLEMPGAPIDGSSLNDFSGVIDLLAKKHKIMRAKKFKYLDSVPPSQRQRVEFLMRRSDLDYRIYLRIFQRSGPPRRGPFFRSELPVVVGP